MDSIKILCFGDSLTEGYSGYGTTFTPYAEALEEWLKTSWPSTEVNVEVEGQSGDQVTSPGSFLRRIKSSCSKATSPFDWVVILGGTNDLGRGIGAEKLFEGLRDVYQVAFDHGAKVLALTIPECHAKSKSLDDKRNSINTKILDFSNEKFHTLDLHSLIPYHALPDAERAEIWDDGLHLTPYGYEVMGDYIAQRLVELTPTKTQEEKQS